ncbi:MAG: Ig-like domain-containing protein [Gemmatimonadota bacterium]|nr:Ig-like domain-containing protein [Gemmatimonadota bacterium]
MRGPQTCVRVAAALAATVWACGCEERATEPATPTPAAPRPTTVTVTPSTAQLVALGATVQLAAEVRDQNGQPMEGSTVTWSSSATAVATVDAAGLVTAVGNGTATIIATAGSASGTAAVTVAQEVSAVTVTPSADTLVVGDTLRLVAEATDANGHPVTGAEFVWASSDTLLATVDATGLVTGVGAGEVALTATSSGVVSQAALTVLARVSAMVTVEPDSILFSALGDTVRLAAEVRDQVGRVMVGASLSWASADTLVASVDSAGLVTAVGNGTARVTAAADEATAQALVTVVQSARSVVVTPPTATTAVGDTLRLVAEAFDANAHPLEGAEFNWSTSDPSVARVDGTGLVLGIAEGTATIAAVTGGVRGTADVTVANPPPKPGPGVNIFDFPIRAVAVGGMWGTTRRVAQRWEDQGQQGSLIPLEFIDWLRSLHVNWVLISVALHYEDSMDSTVSRETDRNRQIPTWRDETLRQTIREFREHGFEVYMTLAFQAHEAETSSRPVYRWQLGDPAPPHTGGVPPDVTKGLIAPENWPWRPDHPDHERFVAEFWETYTVQAEHFAAIGEDEGVALFSLGTETDRLFRSRPDHHEPSRPNSGYYTNDFGDELRTMVDRVRAVYSGRLTYDMSSTTLRFSGHFGRGSGAGHLWEDLDLDIVGISAWFPLTSAPPATVSSVLELRGSYEAIFRDHLRPLADRNPGRAIVFLEYGAIDLVEAPANPGDPTRQRELATLVDENRNGLDDGEETQANIFKAFFEVSDAHPGLVNGAFFWDNWIATNAMWVEILGDKRTYSFRGKLAEAVVRDVYGRWARGGR